MKVNQKTLHVLVGSFEPLHQAPIMVLLTDGMDDALQPQKSDMVYCRICTVLLVTGMYWSSIGKHKGLLCLPLSLSKACRLIQFMHIWSSLRRDLARIPFQVQCSHVCPVQCQFAYLRSGKATSRRCKLTANVAKPLRCKLTSELMSS